MPQTIEKRRARFGGRLAGFVMGALLSASMSASAYAIHAEARCSASDGIAHYVLRVDEARGRGQFAVLSRIAEETGALPPREQIIQRARVKFRGHARKSTATIKGKGLIARLEVSERSCQDGENGRSITAKAKGEIRARALHRLGHIGLLIDCTIRDMRPAPTSEAEVLCDSPDNDDATCEADVNGDSLIDPLDVGYITARLGCTVIPGSDCETADLNADGFVDPLDFGYLYARWDSCDVS